MERRSAEERQRPLRGDEDDDEQEQQEDQQRAHAAADEQEHEHEDEDEAAADAAPDQSASSSADGAPRFSDNDKVAYRSGATAVMSANIGSMHAIGGRPLMHQPVAGMPSGFSMAPPSIFRAAAKPTALTRKPDASAAPVSTTRTDRTNYFGVQPRDLPPPPFRLEMHTHFHVKDAPIQRVCSVVGLKLCELDTDFVFNADKCKWKIEFRQGTGASRVTLNVVIYKAGDEYVLEAQRRDGDITALMFLYNELKMFFKRCQILVEKEKTTTGVKRPAPEAMAKQPVVLANVRNAVGSVKGLLESKFVDIQMQGVLGAISLSADEESKADMATLVPLLVTLGQAANKDVANLVRVALARLCDHSACRQALVRSEGWHFIVKCAAGGANVKPEVQRDSLRVVECLCSLYSDELAQVEGADKVMELIEQWEGIEDPRLKKHACNAHRALKEAGVIA